MRSARPASTAAPSAGVALCQVAVTFTYATGRRHALIGRAFTCLKAAPLMRGTASWSASRRRWCSPPSRGWPARCWTERMPGAPRRLSWSAMRVYGDRQLRRGIREHGMGLCAGVRASDPITTGSGRTVTAAGAADMIPGHAWHRMRTGSGTRGTRHYDWAMLEVTTHDTPGGHGGGTTSCWPGGTAIPARCRSIGAGHSSRCRYPGRSPSRSPAGDRGRSSACQAEHRPGRRAAPPLEVLAPLDRDLPARLHLPCGRRRRATPARRRLRPGRRTDPGHRPGAAVAPARHRHPAARETEPTGCTGRPGDAATSTASAKPTDARTPTPRQHHDHNETTVAVIRSAVRTAGDGWR